MDDLDEFTYLKYDGLYQREFDRLREALGRREESSISLSGETIEVVSIIADNPIVFGRVFAMRANYELSYWHGLHWSETDSPADLEASARHWARCWILCPTDPPPPDAFPPNLAPLVAMPTAPSLPDSWHTGVLSGFIEACHYVESGQLDVISEVIASASRPESSEGFYNLLSRARAAAAESGRSEALRCIIGAAHKELVTSTPLPDDVAAAYEQLLANALVDLYAETGDRGDLETALGIFRRGLANVDWSDIRSHQATSNYLRAARLEVAHFASIDSLRDALDLLNRRTEESHDPALESQIAAVASSLHVHEHGLLGLPGSLDEAVALGKRSVMFAEGQRPLVQSVALDTLANSLAARAIVWEDPDDLAAMVDNYERAVDATGDALHSRAHALSNLVHGRLTAYDMGAPFAWAQAQKEVDEALEHEREECPERGYTFGAACNAYLAAYEHAADPELLEKAQRLANTGLACTPEVHSQYGRRLADVAKVLAKRFERLDDLPAARAAIEHYGRASQCFPEERESAIYRGEAAEVSGRLYLRGDGAASEAIGMLHAVLQDSRAPGPTRFRAAITLTQIAHSGDDRAEALASLELAVNCLGDVAYTGLRHGDRLERLSGRTWVVAEAASLALALGDVPKALRIVEVGRERMHSEQRELRSDAANGVDGTSILAQRIIDIQGRIDEARATPDQVASIDVMQGQLRTAYADWIGARTQLSITRASRYPTTTSEGQRLVILVPGVDGGYALISPGWSVLPLPLLTTKVCLEEAQAFRRSLAEFLGVKGAGRAARLFRVAQKSCFELLALCWDAAVGPILSSLQAAGPRPIDITWLPVGPAAGMPFHAAGRYVDSQEIGSNALDRIISSYTPSLWTFSRRVHEEIFVTDCKWNVLGAAGDPTAHSYLPAVAGECSGVERLLGASDIEVNTSATSGDLLAALQGATAIHLAGHGISHVARVGPSLVMSDRAVSIAELARLGTVTARWACLSACHSADGDIGLLDEGASIAMQLIEMGCVDVVAAQWQISDQVATEFSAAFYDGLKANEYRSGSTPWALNEACKHLRGGYPQIPFFWAGYVHVKAGC